MTHSGVRIMMAALIFVAKSQAQDLTVGGGTRVAGLTVRVYDLAGVPAGVRREALAECSRILEAAGVPTTWTEGDPEAEEAHSLDMTVRTEAPSEAFEARRSLAIRFVRGLPREAWRGALGFALPNAGYGVSATVFYDRIEALPAVVPLGRARLLANVLAHEIGHVLLGSNAHSRSGIMKGIWSRADYIAMRAGPLEFEGNEAVVLRSRASVTKVELIATGRAQHSNDR